jgi:hypothetical protein
MHLSKIGPSQIPVKMVIQSKNSILTMVGSALHVAFYRLVLYAGNPLESTAPLVSAVRRI